MTDVFDATLQRIHRVATVCLTLLIGPGEHADAVRKTGRSPPAELAHRVLSTQGLVFASACEIVPARTADALAMVLSFIANAPINAMGSVPCSTAARIITMASAVRPSTALSATAKPVTCGLAVRY